MSAPDLTCALCKWSGQDAGLLRRPMTNDLICPRCHMSGGFKPILTAAAPPPSILDAAIAASSALDPLGSRKPDESLRVPTFDELDAERKRVAARIASMGRTA